MVNLLQEIHTLMDQVVEVELEYMEKEILELMGIIILLED